jgi:hypothetical protein
VFATRSPHRPNPLGLSAVRVERIDGLTLHICDVDMLDGTPVLDIKPYVAYTDAIGAAGSGWLTDDGTAHDGPAARDPKPAFEIDWAPLAAAQAGWIEQRTGLLLRDRATATLKLGPEPHPYRRIKRVGEGFTLAVKEWRVRFTVEGRTVRVAALASGFRPAELARGDDSNGSLAAHREFRERWPS